MCLQKDLHPKSIMVMGKQTVAHSYNGVLLSSEREPTTDTCSNMDASHKYTMKWSQTLKTIRCMFQLTWNSRTSKTNLQWWKASHCLLGERDKWRYVLQKVTRELSGWRKYSIFGVLCRWQYTHLLKFIKFPKVDYLCI